MEPPLLTVVLETDDFLAERAIGEVIRQQRTLDATAERRDVAGSDSSAADALAAGLSPSLFGESATVVVSGLTASDESLLSTLCAGIEDPADGVCVVALFPTGGRSKKAMDRLRQSAAAGAARSGRSEPFREVPAAAIKGRRGWVDFAASEFVTAKRRVTRDGLEALVTAVGTDARMLASAVAQLAQDCPADPIGVDEINGTFGGVASMPGYEIADAVWSRNKLLALQRLQWAAEVSPANVGPAVVGALASSLRTVIKVGSMTRASEADIAREAGVHPFKVRVARDQARRWSLDELANASATLARLDADVKGGLGEGPSMDPNQKVYAVQAWIIETIGE